MSQTLPPLRAQHSSAVGGPTLSIEIEANLRAAGLELAGVIDPEAARLARVVFRLAQRVAVDGGRLEPTA